MSGAELCKLFLSWLGCVRDDGSSSTLLPLFLFFSGHPPPPADHRILGFQVVPSVYYVCAEIGPLRMRRQPAVFDYQ